MSPLHELRHDHPLAPDRLGHQGRGVLRPRADAAGGRRRSSSAASRGRSAPRTGRASPASRCCRSRPSAARRRRSTRRRSTSFDAEVRAGSSTGSSTSSSTASRATGTSTPPTSSRSRRRSRESRSVARGHVLQRQRRRRGRLRHLRRRLRGAQLPVRAGDAGERRRPDPPGHPRAHPGRPAFAIVDLTGACAPNVFYELGYADGLGKKVIVTAKDGTRRCRSTSRTSRRSYWKQPAPAQAGPARRGSSASSSPRARTPRRRSAPARHGLACSPRLRELEIATRPEHPDLTAALAARWEQLPAHVKQPNQMLGKRMTGCEGTHGVFPKLQPRLHAVLPREGSQPRAHRRRPHRGRGRRADGAAARSSAARASTRSSSAARSRCSAPTTTPARCRR